EDARARSVEGGGTGGAGRERGAVGARADRPAVAARRRVAAAGIRARRGRRRGDAPPRADGVTARGARRGRRPRTAVARDGPQLRQRARGRRGDWRASPSRWRASLEAVRNGAAPLRKVPGTRAWHLVHEALERAQRLMSLSVA